jgi:hypothetical protein
MTAAEIIEPTRPRYDRGMLQHNRPLTSSTATIEAASSRLFGPAPLAAIELRHRGDYLRLILRSLYGADYRRRGALLLGVRAKDLPGMLSTGRRVSRARVQRLEQALARRMRRRREELRALGVVIEQAFAAELALLDECPALVARLNRMASEAHAPTQPIDARSGRYVSRKQVKAPELRERPRS